MTPKALEAQLADAHEEIALLCESRKIYAEAAAAAEAETESEREKTRQLLLFLVSDAALFIGFAQGVFRALAEGPEQIDSQAAGRAGLARVERFERECQQLLETLWHRPAREKTKKKT